MARFTEHATALGRHGAKCRWQDTSDAERQRIMRRVRAAKKRKTKLSNAGVVSEALR
jgi:hypothetical protein